MREADDPLSLLLRARRTYEYATRERTREGERGQLEGGEGTGESARSGLRSVQGGPRQSSVQPCQDVARAMCGACAAEPMVSFRPQEVVKVCDHVGGATRVGRIAETDAKWGIGVMWEDGNRTWYPYDMWCPDRFSSGFTMVIVDDALFQPAAGFTPARPEMGRGWLPKPPAANRPQYAQPVSQVEECDPAEV